MGDEARAAVTAAAETGLPIWVSWTLDENQPVLRSGESIELAFQAISEVAGANLEACLFNCTSPEICTVAMPIKAAHLAFIDAGAEVIITNNYACVPNCL